MLKVAVVEDEADLCEELCEFLRLSGMEAHGMGSGADLDAFLAAAPCDALVLDVNLPEEDGFQIAERLRTTHEAVGIVMMTARGALADRVHGLRTGADAYLVKPVDLPELVATLESVCRRIRRSAGGDPVQPGPAAFAGWELRRLGWELAGPNGRSVDLTAAEHDLIMRLAECPGHPVSRTELLGLAEPVREADLRKLDAVVRRLRRKVEEGIGLPLPVRAAHGAGYAATEEIAR